MTSAERKWIEARKAYIEVWRQAGATVLPREWASVVRLVEAVAHLDAAESEGARRYRMTYVREALAALVGEEEKSG